MKPTQHRARFTTSAKAQEEKREDREERLGRNFNERIRRVDGLRPPANVKPARDAWDDPKHAIEPVAAPLTEHQKRQTKRGRKK